MPVGNDEESNENYYSQAEYEGRPFATQLIFEGIRPRAKFWAHYHG